MGFLDNYKNLLLSSPKLCLTQWNCENSDYTLFVNHSKNSYLCRGSGWMEDCYYLYWVYHATNTSDCAYCENVELCYECVDCMRCYNCNFCQECRDSSDLTLCYDCTGCKNCFGCIGLKQKEFYFLNEKKTPEEYKILLGQIWDFYKKNCYFPQEILEKYENLKMRSPRRDFILKCEHCAGNHIENSQKCFYCFDMVRSRDCFYNFNAYENIDSIDCSFTKTELGYENVGGGWHFNCDYILFCLNCSDSKFLFQCQDCKHCFGCDGLHHKEYYILNKPYLPEEYQKKTEQIWNELRNMREAGNLMNVFQDEEFQGILH